MGKLILTKHAAPEIVRGAPPSSWVLSSRGAMQCGELSSRLTRYDPAAIVSSREPKARQTAEFVGRRLGIQTRQCPDLHENDRSGLPFFENRDEFEHQLREFFAIPGERVIGEESADEAHARFLAAIRNATAHGDDRTTIVVSHGAVISLLVARANEMDPYLLWLSLDFTSFVVVSTPDLVVHDIVHPPAG